MEQLECVEFPRCEHLNRLLPKNTNNQRGHRIRFVAATELDDTPYEQQIYRSGRVSTRSGNWHDLFNALVWTRFPRIKTVINRLHQQVLSNAGDNQRGPVRDALTLFDECGVIVFSAHTELLELLAERRWQEIFLHLKRGWHADIGLAIIGHALLEKCLDPYKSMTAKTLLVEISTKSMQLSRDALLPTLDAKLARLLGSGNLLTSPARLSPLPLAGVPGWWSADEQDERFYADRQVFRAGAQSFKTATIISMT